MAETLVKNPTCSKCGEDARPEALFCHACGGEIQDLPKDDDGSVSSAWFKGDIVETSPIEASKEPDEKIEEKPIEMPEEPVLEETGQSRDEEEKGRVKVKRKEDIETETAKEKPLKKKLTSASDLRKRPKPIRTKRVEVVWEENTNSPNWLFLVFGLFFGLLGLGLFFLAFYLK
ncbi:MAG: zinc ribbon domain-containing protein [Pyrinomonadaceae bacterium]|nr:zinc ribbon domain-containing protein [Pyrinomonadaceae bacterium]